MGIFLLFLPEPIPSLSGFGSRFEYFLPDSVTQEHGTGNGRNLPQAAVFSQVDAVAGFVGPAEDSKNGFHVGGGGLDRGDDLVRKEGENAFEAAAGAEGGVIAGRPAMGYEREGLEFGQPGAEVKIRLDRT